MRLPLAVALALAGCGGGYSLKIQVHHPPDAAVASTVVSIYESDTTTCKQIEFGDLSTAELQAILVDEQTSGAGAKGELDDTISRTGRKLVVARGFDAAGRFLTAGCAQEEDITGHATVQIDTDFTATISVGAVAPGDSGIPLTLTDALGRSLGNHPVTWRVYGPDGASAGTSGSMIVSVPADDYWQLSAPTCTNDSGVARVHPVPPAKVGGYAIALRPSWGSQPSSLLTSFTKIDPTITELIPKQIGMQNLERPCAIRISGQTRRLVCVQLTVLGGATIAREYEATVQNGNARLTMRATTALDATTVGLFSVDRGPTVRDVYAITQSAQVIGVFGPSVPPIASGPIPGGGFVGEAALVPGCNGAQPPQLVLRIDDLAAPATTSQHLVVMAPTGGPITDYHGIATVPGTPDLSVRATGCVAELRPNGSAPLPRQATVATVTASSVLGMRPTTSMVFDCDLDPTKCRVSLPVPEAGAGLSTPRFEGSQTDPTAPEEPRLTGMFFDASGVVMSSWVLLPPGRMSDYLLVERERVPAASIPRLVVSGRFDTDGVSDMFWDMPSLNGQTSNLQVTYGRTIGTQRLSALSGQQPITVDDLLVGDLTGDGLDDIVLLGKQRKDTATIAEGLIVIPMDVPIPNPDLGSDRSCQ